MGYILDRNIPHTQFLVLIYLLSSILLSSGALTRFFVDRHNLFRMGTDNALLSLALGSVPTVNEEEVMQQLLRAAWMSWGGKWP